jgi:hypothetical protein
LPDRVKWPVVREITHTKKVYKHINLESNRECAKGLFVDAVENGSIKPSS